ncbi:MAG: hypothetical protein JW749_11225 [Sedimentisphaerales bacterium]|nr:hypothetical protein [Sedimentisphaerales bacterium]
MLSERKKKIIFITILIGAIMINILPFLFLSLPKGAFADFLFDTGLTRWGWIPAIGFLSASLTLLIIWKPFVLIIRLFIIVISILMLIYDLIWLFGMYIISQPGLWASALSLQDKMIIIGG